jgi:hypothetical protein
MGGGGVYISSIYKNKNAVYFYRNRGKFVLDPTHVSEFASFDEFIKKIEICGFHVISANKRLVSYSLFDGFLRILIHLKIVKPESLIHIFRNRVFSFFRLIKIPIAGFYFVEAFAVKSKMSI